MRRASVVDAESSTRLPRAWGVLVERGSSTPRPLKENPKLYVVTCHRYLVFHPESKSQFVSAELEVVVGGVSFRDTTLFATRRAS
jgi:hypothetical protein